MIVIYTGDVEKAEAVFDMGCMTVKLEQVFISHLSTEKIYQDIKHKLECGEDLTEQELMQLIVLPFARKGMENQASEYGSYLLFVVLAISLSEKSMRIE